MRKKSGFTIVEQAIVLVPEFEKVVRKLEQQVAFAQIKSNSGREIFAYGKRFMFLNVFAIRLIALKHFQYVY